MSSFAVGRARILLIRGDITDQNTDAVVNAANPSLMGGGGVDGAIHRFGGPSIVEECERIRETEWSDGLPTGKAVVTSAGNLRARYVIHAVGPVWKGGLKNESRFLADVYRNSLLIACSKQMKSISFPSISTGAYGYPIEEASKVALATVKEFLENAKAESVTEVRFVLFSEHDLRFYQKSGEEIFRRNLN